jgi:hypothetical protein
MYSPMTAPIGVIPEIDSGGSRLRNLMVYEWEAPLDERCLPLCERLLAEFGISPDEGTGSSGQKRTHGSYKKTRARLAALLASGGGSDVSVRVRSVLKSNAPEFFPSEFEAAFGRVHGGQKVGSFAVDQTKVESPKALVDSIAPIVFGVLHSAYGGCWNFPAEYGAEHYVAAINTMPIGMKWGSNPNYARRLVRWRDNIWHRGLRARDGYFREIYPINFLLEAHLERKFRNAALWRFMKEQGSLLQCEFSNKMYRWDVPEQNLSEVRIALESSGLVLSSEAEPRISSG